MNEHRVIEKVLEALETAAERDVPSDFYARAVDFIAHFADGCHHAKEEGQLFPLLEEKGIPRRMGPIGVMCEEHEQARALVRVMRESIAARDAACLRGASLEYAALLRAHIQKEDNVLFPIARAQLSDLDLEHLRSHFDQTEQPRYQELERLGAELLAEIGACA